MIANYRFDLDKDRNIIDRLNINNIDCDSWYKEDHTIVPDERELRERIIWPRLRNMVDHLLIPNPSFLVEDRDFNFSILWSLHSAIKASHLNTLDIALSLQHRFDGELKREKIGMQDFTSLSLFADDVERLLRDIYGESDNEAIDRVRRAVLVIVEGFAKHQRKEIWQEYSDALVIDRIYGIGVPDGYGIQGHDYGAAAYARHKIALRARFVRSNPNVVSKYTVEFVKALESEWPNLDREADAT